LPPFIDEGGKRMLVWHRRLVMLKGFLLPPSLNFHGQQLT